MLLSDYKPEYEKLKQKKADKEKIEKEKQVKKLESDLQEEEGNVVLRKEKNENLNEDQESMKPEISLYAKEEQEDDEINEENEIEKGNIHSSPF